MTSNKDFSSNGIKRDDFKKYLEKSGAFDALTKALVSLFEEPEKPQDAIKYLCNKLQKNSDCATATEGNEKIQQELKHLQKENEELKAKIQLLETQISTKDTVPKSLKHGESL